MLCCKLHKCLKLLDQSKLYVDPNTWCRLKTSTSAAAITNASDESDKPLSARQRAWQAAQTKYNNYENVHYSSFLEWQLEPEKRWKRSNAPKLRVYPNLEQLRKLMAAINVEEDDTLQRQEFPHNWMDDYEFYEGGVDAEGNVNSRYGTQDPTVPPSKVPCNGCGAHLHCASNSLPGYIPREIFKGRSETELQTITCQRCHFLKHYNIALDVEVTPEYYVETISRIEDQFSLAIIIVDLLDFPCSIWPQMQQVLGSKRPIFIIGNKVDLLPRDRNKYLDHVRQCLKEQFIYHGGFDAMNIKHVGLISAKTGYGIEELITHLHQVWKNKGDIYLMGCTNVGKSTLFNILLNSDYCRPEAVDLVRKATTCPWPGTTLQMLKFPILRPSDLRIYQRTQRLIAERTLRAAQEEKRRDEATKDGSVRSAQLIGNVGRTFDKRMDTADPFAISMGTQPITTFNERKKEYKEAKWCYDTPGVMNPEQITNLLTTEELLQLQSSRMINPRAYRLPLNMSLLLAGLGRIDFVNATANNGHELEWIKLFVFSAINLPIVITNTEHANDVYARYLGTELLGVPMFRSDPNRLTRWPGLQCKKSEIVVPGGNSHYNKVKRFKETQLTCDITLSSAGWVGLAIPKHAECTFRAWTPHARGIFVRTPALIPLANRLIGKHIPNSLAYNLAKPYVFQK